MEVSPKDNVQQIRYYDEHFSELHNTEAEELRWAKINEAILQNYNSTSRTNLTILDLGCSNGWLSKRLSIYGKVTGVDFSYGSIKAAKSQFPGIDFRTIDITTTDIETLGRETFDLIVSSEVIEHVIDQNLFINQVAYLLKKEGTLILTTPNGKWYRPYFAGPLQAYKQPIENWVTISVLKALLKSHFIFTPIKTFYVNWLYSSRNSIAVKLLANDYLREGLKQINLFNAYLNLLEKMGFGLYLIVSAKK